MFKTKKAAISLYIAFIIMAVFIITITAVLAPMGVLFNTEMFTAGEQILLDANASIENISDATIKAELQGSLNNAKAAAVDNIELNNNLFQYSWIFVIALTAFVAYMYTRSLIEYRSGGFI